MPHKKDDIIKKRLENTDLNIKKEFRVNKLNKLSLDNKKGCLPPIQMDKKIITLLKEHFKEKGLNLSSGIRTVLHDYVEKKVL